MLVDPEALPWPSVVPLFEVTGYPRSGSSGLDGDGVSASSSFLKALSLIARGVPGVGSGDVSLLAGSALSFLILGLVGLAVLYPLFGRASLLSLLLAPCHGCLRSCHVVSFAVLIIFLLSIKRYAIFAYSRKNDRNVHTTGLYHTQLMVHQTSSQMLCHL